MIRRWVALGIAEAQKGFRRVKGYVHMPSLVAALRPSAAATRGVRQEGRVRIPTSRRHYPKFNREGHSPAGAHSGLGGPRSTSWSLAGTSSAVSVASLRSRSGPRSWPPSRRSMPTGQVCWSSPDAIGSPATSSWPVRSSGPPRARGARLVSATGEGNGDSPADAFLRTVIDGAAQYERGLVRARTRAALAVKAGASRARGSGSLRLRPQARWRRTWWLPGPSRPPSPGRGSCAPGGCRSGPSRPRWPPRDVSAVEDPGFCQPRSRAWWLFGTGAHRRPPSSRIPDHPRGTRQKSRSPAI